MYLPFADKMQTGEQPDNRRFLNFTFIWVIHPDEERLPLGEPGLRLSELL